MRARVLGSAAGGGFPQWNCACENCRLVRAGDPRVTARTQDSIAVRGGTGDRWLLVNASPDVLRQVERFDELWPRGPRSTPVGAVALTNGDLDHVLGLLSLRESEPLRVLATHRVHAGLVERNAVLRTLARTPDQVRWTDFQLGREVVVEEAGVGVTALAAPGKLPVHLAGLADPSPEDNVALRIRDLAHDGRVIVVATSVGTMAGVDRLLDGANVLLFDGTFWSDDELVVQGLGKARASDMAHVPVGGDAGSLARLQHAKAARRIYTHVNNTNPMLRVDSPERMAVERAGWEVAVDGMEVSL